MWKAWSKIRVIENTDSNKENLLWKQWRDILLAEYDGRLAALGAKGFGAITGKKAFIAIFLRVKGFSAPAPDILPEAIRILTGQGASLPLKEYDAVAMLGHRIGMVENGSGINKYLQDIGPSLSPLADYCSLQSTSARIPIRQTGQPRYITIYRFSRQI